ncbi:excalibur calcium-binding domain-containing protein [Pseudonocardia xishanensis]|uniref:Excalibur calcium-binding domain-containing protein n=1 Tax=Pseudonocardia xishanensis TaxID=630995 RepID=A0ABP8RSA5_9PSEU
MAAKKGNPVAGCGCLVLLVLLLGGLIRSCSGGDDADEPTATQSLLSPASTAVAPTPAPVTPTARAPTTTTRATSPATTTRPAGTPKPQPDPEPNRNSQRNEEPATPAEVYYKNCDAVRAAGAAPIRRGDPGYRKGLDSDGDGEGCGGD